jgi:hypothetical protein
MLRPMRSHLVLALLIGLAACQKKTPPDDRPADHRMAFTILAVDDDRQHNWTFLDVRSRGGVRFEIGLHGARASIAVDDRAAGKQLVEELAKALEVAVPAPGPQGTIGPLEIWSAAIPNELPWTSAIWEVGAMSNSKGSVYLNLDRSHQRGELAFMGPDDSEAFLAHLAASLRDGR